MTFPQPMPLETDYHMCGCGCEAYIDPYCEPVIYNRNRFGQDTHYREDHISDMIGNALDGIAFAISEG